MNMRHFKNAFADSPPRLLVLLYHRVLPKIEFDPFRATVSEKTFSRQIDMLANTYPIISLNDAIRQCQTQRIKSKVQVVLTFDDGYLDNYEFAFPILQKKGLTAAFFLSTAYIGSDKPLWDCELMEILYNNQHIREVKVGRRVVRQSLLQPRIFFIRSALDKFKSLDSGLRDETLGLLRENSKDAGLSKNRCMSWEQIKEVHRCGMEIGAHGVSHTSLTRIPFTRAEKEIKESKEIIEKNIEDACSHFAFPFGSRSDYSQGLIDCVRDSGFSSCLLNIHGYSHLKKDAFCFKRIIMKESTNLQYLLG